MTGTGGVGAFPVSSGNDFRFVQHLIDAETTLAAEALFAVHGGQVKIGHFDGEAAKVARPKRCFVHYLDIMSGNGPGQPSEAEHSKVIVATVFPR